MRRVYLVTFSSHRYKGRRMSWNGRLMRAVCTNSAKMLCLDVALSLPPVAILVTHPLNAESNTWEVEQVCWKHCKCCDLCLFPPLFHILSSLHILFFSRIHPQLMFNSKWDEKTSYWVIFGWSFPFSSSSSFIVNNLLFPNNRWKMCRN